MHIPETRARGVGGPGSVRRGGVRLAVRAVVQNGESVVSRVRSPTKRCERRGRTAIWAAWAELSMLPPARATATSAATERADATVLIAMESCECQTSVCV